MKLNINDEQGIEFLHWIFERELNPPFRKGKENSAGDYSYYNRDDEEIGRLNPLNNSFMVIDSFWYNIKYKVCSAFEYDVDRGDWWKAIKPHLKSWLEDQLNIELRNIW